MSNRIRKSKRDNIKRLNESLLFEGVQSPKTSQSPTKDCYKIDAGGCLKCSPEECNKKTTPCIYPTDMCKDKPTDDDGWGTETSSPKVTSTDKKKVNEDCGCSSGNDTHGDWVEDNLMKIDDMVNGMDNMVGDIGGGGCPPGQYWCNETGDCHDDRSPQIEPLTITGVDIVNLQERISNRLILEQYTNPFDGAGSGPNWDAARNAWANFQQSSQSSPPGPDATFLSNMAGKGCGFYEKRLVAQVDSFVNQFGGSFGNEANSTNISGGKNPAWQSQKYARIMWLTKTVFNCSTSGANSASQSSNASCFYGFINDTTNDGPLTSAICPNGNVAISPQNLEKTKFRWQSFSECNMLDSKIATFLQLAQTTTGCDQVRKQAKHDYLVSLKSSCC